MTGADLFLLLILFYSLILGARRGFYKEVVHFVAMCVGIGVARAWRVPAGDRVEQATSLPPMIAEVVAVVLVWAAVFFVVAVFGRLILKKLRGTGVDDRLDDGAERFADRIGGDTQKGPITLLTDPLASKNGFFYWSDKLLGLLLGLVKGALTGFILLGGVVYAEQWGYSTALAESVRASRTAELFETHVDPYLRAIPEYDLARDVTEIKATAEAIHAQPSKLRDLVEHPQLAGFRRDPRLQALGQDPKVREAWNKRECSKLLLDPKVQELLRDPAFRAKVAQVDWDRVRRDLDGSQQNGSQQHESQQQESLGDGAR